MASGNTRVDVAVIGAGQAGLSLSAALREHGVEHLVLEKGRIAESWQYQRWDSFCLVTPNWSVQLAGLPYTGTDPDGFLPRDDLVAYLNDYAARCGDTWTGVEVTHAAPRDNGWAIGYRRRREASGTAPGHGHRYISGAKNTSDGGQCS